LRTGWGDEGEVGRSAGSVTLTLTGEVARPSVVSSSVTKAANSSLTLSASNRASSGLSSVTDTSSRTVSGTTLAVTCELRPAAVMSMPSRSITRWATA
jgi:hypothetical protein